MRQPLLPDHVEREREPGRDPGAGAERVRPRAARRLRQRAGRGLARDVEEPQQRRRAPAPACSAAAPGRRCRRTGSGRTSRSSGRAARAWRRSARTCRTRCSPRRRGRRRRSTTRAAAIPAPPVAGTSHDQERDRGRDRDRGERQPQPTDGVARRSNAARVAEWDRGRPTPLRPSAAACSTRSASVVASGGPGSGRDQATPAAVARQLGLADDARGQARRAPAVVGVACRRLAQEPDGALALGRRRSPDAASARVARSGAVSTIAPAARRPMPRSASSARGARGRDADTSDSGRPSGRRNAGSAALTAATPARATRPRPRRGARRRPRRRQTTRAGGRATALRRRPSRQAAARQAIVSVTVMWPTPSDDRPPRRGRRRRRVNGATSFDDAGAADERAVDRRRDDVAERIAEARFAWIDPGVDRRGRGERRAARRRARARAPRPRRVRASRAPPPQAPAPVRPPLEALGDRRRARCCRARPGRTRAARSRRAMDSQALLVGARPVARLASADQDLADLAGRRDRGRAGGRRRRRGTTAPRSGPGRRRASTSQRSARSLSQMPGETASMKSETTKTNVPAGKLDACRTSASEAAVERRRPGGSRVGPAVTPRRARGPSAAGRRRASAVGPLAARRRRARRRRQPSRGRSTRSRPRWPPALSSHGQRRPVELHPRAPVDRERDQRRRVGEELADDELVGAARGRESCRRAPVDPGRPVARPVRPRARDLVSLARAVGSGAGRSERRRTACAERGRRDARPRGSRPSGAAPASQSGSGRGTRSRQAARMPSRRSLSLGIAADQRVGRQDQPVPDDGSEEPLDVLGDT